jgi:N,N'-diacetyllegionaminate synthase
MKKKVTIIAEIGVNHNGSLKKAKQLILTAKKCGADFVKFQYFKAVKLVQSNTNLAEYQKKNSRDTNQLDLLKKLELSKKAIIELKKFAKKKKIQFFCSIFNEEDVNFLNKVNDKYFKIPSGEFNNIFILNKIINFNKKIILSTGATTAKEIKDIFFYLKKKKVKKKKLILMHCISKYPTKLKDLNFNYMKNMKKIFKTEIGFSDHTKSKDTGMIAATLGVSVIEKHLTLNNNLRGPDHKASLNPKDFRDYVKKIRDLNDIMGKYKKSLSFMENKNKLLIRKSLVAKKKIKIGDLFSEDNLTAKRPLSGKSPLHFMIIKNKKSKKNYNIGQKIV